MADAAQADRDGLTLYLPPAYAPLGYPDCRRAFMWGGRGGARSFTTARWIVLQAALGKERVLSVRHLQEDITQSQRMLIQRSIEALGLQYMFPNYTNSTGTIRGINGSEFVFRGLHGQGGVRSIFPPTILWVEEAHEVKREDWDPFLISILRPGAGGRGIRIYITGNVVNRNDPVYEWCERQEGEPGCYRIFTTFRDNPWFPRELDRQRLLEERYNAPAYYRHVWEGEPYESLDELHFLSYADLEVCWKVWEEAKQYLPEYETQRETGFDPALSHDKASSAHRAGPFLEAVRIDNVAQKNLEWEVLPLLVKRMKVNGSKLLNYDSGGIGTLVQRYFRERPAPPFRVRPVSFGKPVGGPELTVAGQAMKDRYAGKNCQMAWNLHQRAIRSRMWLTDKSVPLAECLAINREECCSGKPGQPTEDVFVQEMTQAIYWYADGGMMYMDKAPDSAQSPDVFDAVCLAFHSDVRNGLR